MRLHSRAGETIRKIDEAIQHPIQRIKHLIIRLRKRNIGPGRDHTPMQPPPATTATTQQRRGRQALLDDGAGGAFGSGVGVRRVFERGCFFSDTMS